MIFPTFHFKTTETLKSLKNNCGVYMIQNCKTGNSYIGSAQNNFWSRYKHHYYRLRDNKHKNSYLQRSFNKYGIESFKFYIIEKCSKSIVLEKEQYYLDQFMTKLKKKKCYNLSNIASGGCTSPEINAKRVATMRKNLEAKGLKWGYWMKGISPPNKGKKASEALRKKLSKAAKNRKITKEGLVKRTKSIRSNLPNVYVYDSNKNFIREFKNVPELSEASQSYDFELIPFMILRNPNGRSGKAKGYLSRQGIGKVLNGKKEFVKGLHFSYQPLHQVIGE